jgi:hypothetical protein
VTFDDVIEVAIGVKAVVVVVVALINVVSAHTLASEAVALQVHWPQFCEFARFRQFP